MRVKDIVSIIEEFAPLQYQESYDNSGLCIGNPDDEVQGALLCIDITEEVLTEALTKNCNLIISHHPLIFSGLKKLTGKNYTERCVLFAVKNNLNIYCAHTNVDAVWNGVSQMMGGKIGLINTKILQEADSTVLKLVTFVPESHVEIVRKALFDAGAGNIGNYSSCSYNTQGQGTFKAEEEANPFVGNIGELHFEKEIKIELIVPRHLKNSVIKAMISSHPYEEVAYDIIPLENSNPRLGFGLVGELSEAMDEKDFLEKLKKIFNATAIRHTKLLNKKVKKVALCGGSGSNLLNLAIQKQADVFISGDFKYHQFFDTNDKIIIADIGHYESEQFTKEIFYNLLVKKFPKFALHFSNVNTNPINYL